MKQIFLFASATFLLFSCNESQSKLNREQYDSLVSVIYERDESITHFANSLNDVEQNLDSITVKQHVIFLNYAKSGEFSASQKTRINNEIKAINFLMKKNIVKIDELTKKLNASSTKNTALEKTIKTIIDFNDDGIDDAITNLIDKKIIKYSRHYDKYNFFDSSLVDIDSIIDSNIKDISDEVVPKTLNSEFVDFVLYVTEDLFILI